MLLLHMQGIVPVDFRRAFCPLEGGSGWGGQTYWHQDYTFFTVCSRIIMLFCLAPEMFLISAAFMRNLIDLSLDCLL